MAKPDKDDARWDYIDCEQTDDAAKQILQDGGIELHVDGSSDDTIRINFDTHSVDIYDIPDKPGTVMMRFYRHGSKKPDKPPSRRQVDPEELKRRKPPKDNG